MRRLAWLLVTAACATGSPAPAPPPQHPTPDAAPTATNPPTERECDELFTHAVKLGIDERAAEPAQPAPSAPATTQADHEDVRRKLHEDFMTGCRTLPRETYRCALAAGSLAALAACHSTRSSSTSNKSVAPGGMTPPAPRSP